MADINEFRLRPMQADDMQTIYTWRTQPHVSNYMFSDDEFTMDDHQRWFARTLKNNSSDYQILEHLGRPVGLANAVGIDADKHQCHWGFYLGESDTPTGSGTVLGKLMLDHIFAKLPVEVVFGEAFAFNTASLKLHDKLGFRLHPELARTQEKQGKTEDVVVMSISARDWQA